MGRTRRASKAALPEDDLDKFHAERDKRRGVREEESEEEASSQDEAMWDLDAAESSEEDEDEDDEEQGGDEEDEEDEDDEELEEGWGDKRSAFHGGDVGDEAEADTTDEEEEEEEATRLQKKHAQSLEDEDFMFGALAKVKQVQKKKKKKKPELEDEEPEDDDVEVEQLDVDTSAMSPAQLEALVQRQSPELVALLDEFTKQLTHLRERVQPLLESSTTASAEGLSFLQVKNQLLLAYCTNVVFYTVLKASGRAVAAHPVVKVLVELRTVLEKLKPIDAKLRYQVDKLLKLGGARTAEDLSQYKPNPEQLVLPEEAPRELSREAPQGLLEEPEEEAPGKKRRRKERTARVVERSGLLEEMRAELGEAPEEGGVGGARGRVDEEAAQRIKYEEETFTRMTNTKADRRKGKEAVLERFDPLADMEGIGESFGGQEEHNPVSGVLKKKSLKAQLRQLSAAGAMAEPASGDQDLPYHGKRKASQYQPPEEEQGEEDWGLEPVRGNELYESVRAQGEQKLSKKAARRQEAEDAAQAAITTVDEDEQETGKKRGASKKIMRNVGLIKYRNKDLKNPRVANRIKATRKGKKLKNVSAAANLRDQNKPYSGEATGIKSNLVKSQTLTGAVKH